MLLDFSHVSDIAMVIEDPRVEPFVEWSGEIENPSDNSHHSSKVNPDDLDIRPRVMSAGVNNLPTHPSGARAADATFRTAMEAVLNNLNNSTVSVSQRGTPTTNMGGLSDARTGIRVNGNAKVCFKAAMDVVRHETARRTTHDADTSAEVSTQDADINVRNNRGNRNTNDSENNVTLNNHILIEGELPDIDQPTSEESYPSYSAFSFQS